MKFLAITAVILVSMSLSCQVRDSNQVKPGEVYYQPPLPTVSPKGATRSSPEVIESAVAVGEPVGLKSATSALPQFPKAGITLAWDYSPEDLVTGYKLYYGVESGGYTNSITVGTATNMARITGLEFGQKYFVAATAVTADGMESDFSNEVSATTPPDFFYLQTQTYFISTTGFYGITNNLMAASVLTPTNWIPVYSFFGDGSMRFYHQTNNGAGQLFKVVPR